MQVAKRLVAGTLVALLAFGGVACGDDPGEDQLGDGEINDAGD